MFTSGNQVISAEIRNMLERAITLDPAQQKGLWLLGFASSQSGNDAMAIDYWNRLLAQMDPSAADASSAVREQIEQASARLGIEPGSIPGQSGQSAQQGIWQGINIEVSAMNGGFEAPEGAVLFIIARNPRAPGPPVAVRRIFNPVFPVNIRLSDADSMVPQSPMSAVGQVQLLARLSLSGIATAGEKDPQSGTTMVDLKTQDTVSLELLFPDP